MRRSSAPDKADPAEAMLREVGARLRELRLERGEELDAVAQTLRIRPAYLAAIEAGDLSALPGRTYALGFLRSYADHLGLDGPDLVARIRSAVTDVTRRQRLRVRAPMPESRLPKAPVLALSLVLVALVYGAWLHLRGSGEEVAETVSEVPAELRRQAIDALAPLPEATAGIAGTAALAAARQGVAATVRREIGGRPGQATEPGAGPAAAGAARVVLRALATSWVHVSSASGDYREVRTLEAGEELALPGRDDLSLWTGNAGGLEIVVDGRALPPLGPEGRVVRDVALAPQDLLDRAGAE